MPSNQAAFDEWIKKPKRSRGDFADLIGKPMGTPQATLTNSEAMVRSAQDIAKTEGERYGAGLDTLTGAYNESRRSMADLIDPNLLFSKASDAIGARSGQQLNDLRSSLGARGLNPNSGAASGMLSRLQFQREGALTGATRDIAIENQRQRQVNAALNFSNALNLANYQNSPASAVMLDTYQNLFEGDIAREGIRSQRKSQQEANQTNFLGGLIGAGAGILGGLI